MSETQNPNTRVKVSEHGATSTPTFPNVFTWVGGGIQVV